MLTGETPSLLNTQIGICQKPNAQFLWSLITRQNKLECIFLVSIFASERAKDIHSSLFCRVINEVFLMSICFLTLANLKVLARYKHSSLFCQESMAREKSFLNEHLLFVRSSAC
jgi:hypothetical protein